MSLTPLGYVQNTSVGSAVTVGTGMSVVKGATVAAGGTGYKVGDLLKASGGTFDKAAEFTVTSVSAGAVTGITIARNGDAAGYYSKAGKPANAVSTTAVTGSGSGCTLTLTYTDDVPPAGATHALVQAEAVNLRWRDDGAVPTATVGNLLEAAATGASGQLWISGGQLRQAQFIQVSAGGILNVAFYKS